MVEKAHATVRFQLIWATGLVAFVCEWDAFHVLATRRPNTRAFHGVSLGLLLIGLAVTVPPLLSAADHWDRDFDVDTVRLRDRLLGTVLVTLRLFRFSRSLPFVFFIAGVGAALSVYGVVS